ncbi:MAG: restriction endonuclease subunit S, partial [SAR324 cluster bacterium]|nr:restriction endonuclease subunit S [SAR324 cluster bacterium]
TTSKKKIDNARRFDSEYFHPKYDKIIKKIENYYGGWGYVKDAVEWSKGAEVGSKAYINNGFDFIRVSDFSIYGVSDSNKKIGTTVYNDHKRRFAPIVGDILFTKDGTIGLSYVIKEDMKCIISGAFLRLKIKNPQFLSECLCLLLNSTLIKNQIDKTAGGAIISHLRPSDFENFKMPIFPKSIQQAIASKVEESYRLRAKSKVLLGQANKIVEDEMKKGAEKYELIAGGNI